MPKVKYATQADIKETQEDIEHLDNKIDQVEKSLKDEMIEMKLEILTELKDMREEFKVHQFSHVRINDEFQEHDKRLRRLESFKN